MQPAHVYAADREQGNYITIPTLLSLADVLYWLNSRRNQRPTKPVDIHSCQLLGIESKGEKAAS